VNRDGSKTTVVDVGLAFPTSLLLRPRRGMLVSNRGQSARLGASFGHQFGHQGEAPCRWPCSPTYTGLVGIDRRDARPKNGGCNVGRRAGT
jgi:hypothetical protein